MVPTLLKYSSKIVNKKKVTGSDSTGVIKVKLWANNIKEVLENEKYFLERVAVRVCPSGVLNLAITPLTKVTPSNKEISQVSAARICYV